MRWSRRDRLFSLHRRVGGLATFVSVFVLGGCAGIVNDFADNLGDAVFNQTDPQIIADGAPAYLILLDSLIEGNPDNQDTLAAAADLYAAYGSVFARDPLRAKVLTERALGYAERAACLRIKQACEWPNARYEAFVPMLARIKDDKDTAIASSYTLASLAYIRAHADDYAAIARLPHMQALIEALLPKVEGGDQAALYYYLGILSTLRGPGLGDDPDVARSHFDKAIALTEGQDLSVKVEYARSYARTYYERELHDRLLNEVLAADPVADGYTLTNTLAQRDAQALLDSADDYF